MSADDSKYSIFDALVDDGDAAVVTGGGGDAGAKGAGATRVVSFNLNEKMRDPDRAEEIVAILVAVDADVLCLQEISDLRDVGALARRLKMFCRLSAAANGMAVLSRRPITRVRRHLIPDSYFNALVAVETGGVWYASIHLNSESYKRDEAERRRETAWILERFSPARGVMAGDWNSVSHLDAKHSGAAAESSRASPKTTPPSELLEKHGWVDTHADAMVESTWMQAKPGSVERIDRIYTTPKMAVLKLAILGPRDFPFLKHGWPTGRDHRLVLADLKTAAATC